MAGCDPGAPSFNARSWKTLFALLLFIPNLTPDSPPSLLKCPLEVCGTPHVQARPRELTSPLSSGGPFRSPPSRAERSGQRLRPRSWESQGPLRRHRGRRRAAGAGRARSRGRPSARTPVTPLGRPSHLRPPAPASRAARTHSACAAPPPDGQPRLRTPPHHPGRMRDAGRCSGLASASLEPPRCIGFWGLVPGRSPTLLWPESAPAWPAVRAVPRFSASFCVSPRAQRSPTWARFSRAARHVPWVGRSFSEWAPYLSPVGTGAPWVTGRARDAP